MLDYDPDPHTADLVAYLMTEVPASDNADELYRRSECVKILLGMTDPGCADRFARMASASATMPHAARARAAVRLADLGDPRAAELLAGLTETTDTDDFDELEVRQDVAWALVRLGDPWAIEPLVTVAAHTAPIWHWWRQVRTAAKNGNPATADMLVAMASAPDLPPEHRCEILLWLTLIGEPRGIEGAVRAASDPGMTPSLRTLADGLARRRDRRFVTLLTRWVDSLDDVWHSDEDRRWATRVLASPEAMLGDGLNADYVTAQEIGPSGRFRLIEDLFTTDHPRAMDCLLAMYHDFEARDDVDDDHNSTLYHVVNMLAARDSLVVVPRLAARVRDTDRYDGSEALKALTKLDGQVVADTLVALAPHVVSTDQWTLAHKLLDMADPRAGGLLAEWVIAETRRYPFDGVDWRLDRLRERHDPHLVTVYEHLMDEHLSGRGRLRPRRAIDDLAEVGGPHAVELLTRWAADPRLTEEDRETVAHVLATSDGGPVPEVGEPVSELEYLFRYYART